MNDFCGEHATGRDRIPDGLRGGDFQNVEDALKRGVVEEGGLGSNEAGRRCPDEIADAGGFYTIHAGFQQFTILGLYS